MYSADIEREILPTARKSPKSKKKIKTKTKNEWKNPTATRPESSFQLHVKLTDWKRGGYDTTVKIIFLM